MTKKTPEQRAENPPPIWFFVCEATPGIAAIKMVGEKFDRRAKEPSDS